MLLAIDIGNTNMEFGIFSNGKLTANFRLVTNRHITSDEIGLLMRNFFEIHGILYTEIHQVMIASVVPQVVFSVSNAMRKYLSLEPFIIGENCEVPIENFYSNPKEVGADRLVNAYAAHRAYGGSLIVVDFGTATTFDVVNENGAYEGGCSFPGIQISMEALNHNAAKLPRVEITSPSRVVAKDTVSSMQAGAICGFVGASVYTITQMKRELGCPIQVIATGGLAGLIHQNTDVIDYVDKSLTLRGLYEIWRQLYGKSTPE